MPTLSELGIDKLSLDDRISLARQLASSIDRELEDEPLTEAQAAELDRRLENSIKHPDRVTPWEVVKADLMAKIQSLRP